MGVGVGVAITRVLSIDEKGSCCPVILMPKDSEANSFPCNNRVELRRYAVVVAYLRPMYKYLTWLVVCKRACGDMRMR